jgi:predicted Zn-dependent protease
MQLLRFLAISLILVLSVAAPARAITLLRDPDIEYALRELATPILRAAGLSANRVDILVIRTSTPS